MPGNDDMGYLVDKIEFLAKSAAADVSRDAKSLAHRLTILADKIDKSLARNAVRNLILNSLGEIQSSGTILDAKCARYAALFDALDEADAIMDSHEGGEE